MAVSGDIQPVKRSWGCSCGGKHSVRERSCGSIRLDDEQLRLPDLALYSQAQAIAAGHQPSWDNPDIMTNSARPLRLLAEMFVRVHNVGAASASNAYVHLYLAPFGIGTPKMLFASRQISLRPGEHVGLTYPLDAATLSGPQRIGVHVRVEHPFDTNQINNAGAQVVQSHSTSEVGRSHSIDFPVANDSDVPRRIVLSVLSTDVITTLTPTNYLFAPHEQINVRMEMRIPDTLIDRKSVV